MNIFLWILQILLAIHTLIGAIWKFSNSEQTVISLQALPHSIWLLLILIEFLSAIGLILPLKFKKLVTAAPLAALIIMAEMLLFVFMHLFAGIADNIQMYYWIVVAAISGYIAFFRLRIN